MNYFKRAGQSSGKLGTFRNGGNPCQDMVLERERLEAAGLFWTYAMEMGNIMEAIAQDIATGSKIFESRFFVTELTSLGFGDGSKAAAVVHGTKHNPKGGEWEPGEYELQAYLANMDSLINRNLDGSEHRTHKGGANALAKECMANPWKIPVTQTDFKSLKELANKIMDYPLPNWWWKSDGWTVGDFLSYPDTRWQEEIYWRYEVIDTAGGAYLIPKKSKLDGFLAHGGVGGIIDLKWTGSFPTHMSRLRGGKWLQAAHYEESVHAKFGVRVLPMLYVVGIAGTTKGEPPLVTAISMKDGKCTGRPRCFCSGCREAEYRRTCLAFHQWEQSGRRGTGFLESKEVEVWV